MANRNSHHRKLQAINHVHRLSVERWRPAEDTKALKASAATAPHKTSLHMVNVVIAIYRPEWDSQLDCCLETHACQPQSAGIVCAIG